MKTRGLLYVLFCSEVLIGVWIKMVCVFEYNFCVWVNFLCVNKIFCKNYFDFTIQGSTEWRPPRIFPPFLLSIPLISISSSFYLIFFHIHTHSILKVIRTPLHLWHWKSAVKLPISRRLILLTFVDTISKRYIFVEWIDLDCFSCVRL